MYFPEKFWGNTSANFVAWPTRVRVSHSFGEPVSTFISLWCRHARRFYSMSYMSPRRQSWELRSRQEVERNTVCSLIIKETCSEGEEGVNSGAGGECHLNTLDIYMKLFKSLKKTTVDILYGLSFVTWPHIASKLARLYIYLKSD